MSEYKVSNKIPRREYETRQRDHSSTNESEASRRWRGKIACALEKKKTGIKKVVSKKDQSIETKMS